MNEIIGSVHVQCQQCGGRDFRLEDGYYYCSECQLQTQEFQDHVMEAEYGGTTTRSKKIKDHNSEAEKSQTQNDSEKERDASYVSSWEILNFALKGLVEELILLGAPKSLKPITLQLWASYLGKSEVAFTSSTLETKPKFGVVHRPSDAKIFYKATSSVKNFTRMLQKRKYEQKKKKNRGLTVKSKRIMLGKDKRALAKEVYDNESIASSSFADSQSSLNASSLSTSLASLWSQPTTKRSKPDRFSYSRKGKSEVDEFITTLADTADEDAILLHQKFMDKTRRHSVQYATFTTVMAILRIALLLSGSNIHVGDMRRWMDEGYLSLDCLHKFIPSGVRLMTGQLQVLHHVPFFLSISEMTRKITVLLSISDDCLVANDLILALVKRYCIMMNLPDTIVVGIAKLLEMKPVRGPISSIEMSNYEAKAMAFILFSLKVLIGLDDATEYAYVPRKGTEGVKWEEWCRQYVARMAEKAVTHHPTLCRLYPNSFVGRNHSLLSNWDPTIGRSSLHMESNEFDLGSREAIKQILQPLVCRLPEPSYKPGLERDVVRTGPCLAVLSERPVKRAQERGSQEEGTGCERSVVLTDIYRGDHVVLNFSENIRVELEDDDDAVDDNDDAESDDSEPHSLFPVDNILGRVRFNELPDSRVWMYHSFKLRKESFENFDKIVQKKLPFSFLWLLEEMSNLIYQPKSLIYSQLTIIETAHNRSRRDRNTKSWL